MTSQGIHNPRITRTLAAAAALLIAAVAFFAAASPAHAHDELVGSDPAADATLDAFPAQLTLTFSASIAADAGASEVAVTDAAGASLTSGAPSVQDNVLTQPLAGEASGVVTVLWKVVSSDGHPISGEFAFTVAGGPEPTPTATATPTPAEPSPVVTPEVSETAAPPAEEDSTFGDVWPWVVFGVLGIAVLGAIVYLLASRARRAKGPSAGSSPESGAGSDR